MPAARRRATLLLGVLCIASPMPARAQGRLYSPIEAAAVGRAVLDAQVARYGRVRNANWDKTLRSSSQDFSTPRATPRRTSRTSSL